MPSQHDDVQDPPPAPAEQPPSHRSGSRADSDRSAGYRPPRSPAYSPPAPPPVPDYVVAETETATAPEATNGEAEPVAPAPDRSVQTGWYLLLVGAALVLAAAAVGVAVVLVDDGGGRHRFGEVTALTGDAVVHAGDPDGAGDLLEVGDVPSTGWTVELRDGASATIELRGGGVARFDRGARVSFVDEAVDPDTGDRVGDSRPALRVTGGRAWVNPGGSSHELEVQIAEADIRVADNPLALDCTGACTVAAPAGGVTVAAGDGAAMMPAADEVLTFSGPDVFDLDFSDSPSDWAAQNLDADRAAGLPDPEPDDGPGIRGTAILDGDFAVQLAVVGGPIGDPLPPGQQYNVGESYSIGLAADGTECAPAACRVPVSAAEGVSGTAVVSEGSIALTWSDPIDCFAQDHTVAEAEIGNTTVAGTLEVTGVDYDGSRWVVGSFEGGGTIAVTLVSACNPGDLLGTAAWDITVTGT